MYWWNKKANFRQIADWGHDLLTTFPGARLFVLGQTMAWVAKAAQIQAQLTGAPVSIGYIPFSNTFARNDSIPTSALYEIEKAPTGREGIAWYRRRLKQRGADPDTITRQFNDSGVKTVIVDYMSEGLGVASFTGFLFGWARERQQETALEKALHVHAFVSPGSASKPWRELRWNPAEVSKLGIDLTSSGDNAIYHVPLSTLQPHNANLLAMLSVEPQGKTVRLVPPRPAHDWGVNRAPLLVANPLVSSIKIQLKQTVTEKCRRLTKGEAPVRKSRDILILPQKRALQAKRRPRTPSGW